MDNIKSYIVAGLMLLAGLMPSVDHLNYSLPMIMSAQHWIWWVLISGFLGFYTLFLKVPLIIKFIGIGTFTLCFFSMAPVISFTQYIVVLMCCYFYILCLKIKDYKIIYKCLQCLLLFNLFFFIMQGFNQDRLLNFGIMNGVINYGIIGQNMQSASFMVILSAVLIPFRSLNLIVPFITSFLCNSVGAFISVSVGLSYYLSNKINKKVVIVLSLILISVFSYWIVSSGKLYQNINTGATGGRLVVWIESLKLSWQHPFVGYGIGTYKAIFPSLTKIKSIPWMTAHNTWIQLIFETGYIFTSVLFGYSIYLITRLYKLKKWECVTGLLMIGTNMLFHFPDRMIQCILIIIFFLTVCQREVYCGSR